jgi:type 1 glutamine amidotransferase
MDGRHHLRGPAQNVTVLASAYSDPAKGGSGEDEPLLMAISYGKGRVFHTALGHGLEAIKCVGFATTLQRGTEWAATGKVTQPVPVNFPTRGRKGRMGFTRRHKGEFG